MFGAKEAARPRLEVAGHCQLVAGAEAREEGALRKCAGWLAALGIPGGAASLSCALERHACSRSRAEWAGSLCSPEWSWERRRAPEGLVSVVCGDSFAVRTQLLCCLWG